MKASSTVLLTLALVGVQPAFAGDGQREHRAQHRQQMQEQFGITDDQASQMREIRRNGGSREDAHAVLTDEQRSAMRQWREENPDRRPPRGGRDGSSAAGGDAE